MMFEQIISLQDYIPIISVLISSFAAYKITRIKLYPQTTIPVLEKQLYNVYLPLFKLLDKNLFQDRKLEDIAKILPQIKEIIDNHYELVNPQIISCFNDCAKLIHKIEFYEHKNNKLTSDRIKELRMNFKEIEITVSTEFDKIRSRLGLPTRSFGFKIANNQLTPLWNNVFNFFAFSLSVLVLVLLILIPVNAIFYILLLISEHAQSFMGWLFF